MAWLARGLSHRMPATGWKSTADTLELFRQVFGAGRTANTGDAVSWQTALQVATVLACVRVVANGISQVPLKLMRESADGRVREPAKDHPLYWVLFRKPNPWQSSFEYRQTIGMHLMLCGNHYSYINRVGNRIAELIPFEPGQITVDRLDSGDLKYVYRGTNGGEQEIPVDRMWHLRGLSWNGWFGLEAVSLARESIGLAMATERQQSMLFKNGVQASGAYSIDGKLTADQYVGLRDWLVANTSGANTGMPLILDRGAKWLQQSMTGVDAQHLETRMLQVQQVCSALGVFPMMVGHADKTATFASAEQFFIAHVVHTLAPLYECIEQSIVCNLLTEAEMRGGYSAKFIEEGLLRGSMEQTANMLEKYTNGGLMTPNEARAKLDLNPDSDPASDELRIPANIVGKAEPPAVSSPDLQPSSPIERQPQVDAQGIAQMLADAVSAIQIPAPVVNVPAALPPAAPRITVESPQITVEAPQITVNVPEQPASVVNVAPPSVTVEAPQVTVQPAAVTVPEITVNPPAVTVQPANVNVTVEKGGRLRFVEDGNGTLTGAVLE